MLTDTLLTRAQDDDRSVTPRDVTGRGWWPWLIGATSAATFLVTLVHVVRDSTGQLMGYVADDAFYYFDIARRFPHMGTAPGLSTTGFHPLYWLLLVPITHLLPGTAGVRFALLLLLACHIVAGWLLFALLRRRWPNAVAGALAIFWVAGPVLQAIVLLGLETGVAELALIALLLACDPVARATPRRSLGVGIMLGLSYLARNDSVVIAVPVVAAWMWCRRRDFRGWRSVAVAPAVGALVAAPWFADLLARGSVLTDSARALPTLAYRQVATGTTVHATASGLVSMTVALGGMTISSLPLAVLVVAVVVGLGLLWGFRAWTPVDVALFASVPVLFTLYVVELRGARQWYFFFVAVWLFVLVLPPIAARVAAMVRPLGAQWPKLLAALGVSLIAVLVAGAPVRTSGELDKYHAAGLAQRLLPAGTRIGAFNSGVIQFFLERDDVVNLDGVVNPAVTPYLEHHRLCQYLRETHVHWYLDWSLRLVSGQPGIRVVSSRVLIPWSEGHVQQVLARLQIAGCPRD